MGLRYWVSNNLPNNAGAGGLWHISSKNLEDNSVQASKKISTGRAIRKGLEAGEEWLKSRMLGSGSLGGDSTVGVRFFTCSTFPHPYTEPDDNSCPLVFTESLRGESILHRKMGKYRKLCMDSEKITSSKFGIYPQMFENLLLEG